MQSSDVKDNRINVDFIFNELDIRVINLKKQIEKMKTGRRAYKVLMGQVLGLTDFKNDLIFLVKRENGQ